MLLVALGRGINVSDFLIGSRYNWNNIMETIHLTYFLVGLGLFFSLSASLFLVTVLIQEFLTPVQFFHQVPKPLLMAILIWIFRFLPKMSLASCQAPSILWPGDYETGLLSWLYCIILPKKHQPLTVNGRCWSGNHQSAEPSACWIMRHSLDEWRRRRRCSLSLEHLAGDEALAIRNCAEMPCAALNSHWIERGTRQIYYEHAFVFWRQKIRGNLSYFPRWSLQRKTELFRRWKRVSLKRCDTISHWSSKSNVFEQAITDGLTKLYLRRFFLATFWKEINRSLCYQLDVSVLLWHW